VKRLSVFSLGVFVLLFATSMSHAQLPRAKEYTRVNLVSDIAGVARFTDPHLVNPWGLVASATSPFWIADNNGNVSTLYNAEGEAFPVGNPLIVTIPSPTAPTGGTPTGVVFNGTSDFVISQGPKSGAPLFLFATEDGTILGWNPNVNLTSAVIAKDNSGLGAVYKGLAIASTANGNFIYATNFHAGVVEMYDKNFHLVKSFTDSNVDMNFAPFGIQNINDKLWVTFALQKLPDKHDDQAGPGNGYVDVFDTEGNMIQRFATKGTLNSPWGLALAPVNFGKFSGHLLVGNFGDGRINAFDDAAGNGFAGQFTDPEGNPLTINGLWALRFGGGSANNGRTNQLFFTAGIADESHGLFGFIHAGSGNNE
jgi:uncharacterized protein (TIGR03118 family)